MSRLVLDRLVRREGKGAMLDLSADEPVVVPSGELVVLTGPAGSGKSTLARVVAGLEPLESGRILLGDRDIATLAPQARRVGWCPQADTLWPHWSLAQNLAFPLWCRGIGRKERKHRLNDLVADAELDDLANRKPHEVSADARARTLLARAIALDPELLIIDEPFGPAGPNSLGLDRIRKTHQTHRLTTLVLTRNATQALALADRVGVMLAGRVAQLGTPAEVYSAPASLEVGQAFGPLNQAAGVVEAADRRGGIVVSTTLGRMTVRGSEGRALGAGQPVRVLFRPESLAVGSVGFGANRFPATVVRKVLEGPVCRLEIQGPGGWQGTATLLSGQAAPLRDGQTLSMSLPGEAVTVVGAAASAEVVS